MRVIQAIKQAWYFKARSKVEHQRSYLIQAFEFKWASYQFESYYQTSNIWWPSEVINLVRASRCRQHGVCKT